MSEKPISEVLQQITRLGSVDFSFNPEVIPVNQIVTINATNKTIREILDEVLTRHGIDYFKIENHIVLKQQAPVTSGKTGTKSNPPPRFTLSGYLRDKATGEVLIGANVFVKGTAIGAMTNGYGFYSLTLTGGVYPIVFSYMGYREQMKEINMNENSHVSVVMEEN